MFRYRVYISICMTATGCFYTIFSEEMKKEEIIVLYNEVVQILYNEYNEDHTLFTYNVGLCCNTKIGSDPEKNIVEWISKVLDDIKYVSTVLDELDDEN